jgi:glycosyltransferase involved in cell wall biosynthesis
MRGSKGPAVPARIAFLHSSGYFGSTEQSYLEPLLERLDPAAFEAWLVTSETPELEPLHALAAVRGRSVSLSLPPKPSALAWIRAYRRALRRIRPNLVHCADVDPPAMIAARLAGARRVVVTYHTPELRPLDSRIGRIVRRLAWATRPHVVFTSEFDRETGLRSEPIGRGRTSVIGLPVDLERFDPARARDRLREELGLDGARIVGTVGLLKPQKGHRFLIAAAEIVVRAEPDVRFVAIGGGVDGGKLLAELERDVREHGLEGRFVFLGQREDVQNLVSGFDVFALSSTFEGMCIAVAEALALEKPVVATAVGGVRQTVVPGETGLLVPPSDPAALADGVLWMLHHPDDAQRMAVAGGERVRRLYSVERVVSETAALYGRLLSGRAGASP